MTPRYAAKTTVTPERSRAELERLLRRYGATRFAYDWSEDGDRIHFRVDDRTIRITMPDLKAEDIDGGRNPAKALDQARAQRWRALLLVVKAKLEAIAAGISTLESEFLAGIVTASGQTVGELIEAEPRLLTAREPRLLFDDSR